MYCPHCGTQQASNEVRFCSRCGFPLHAVAEILANGGNPPALAANSNGKKLTSRQKGIRQGAMLMLSTLLVVPLVAIISVFIFHRPQIFVPLAAIGCFIGGLLRIMYALLIEDNTTVSNEPLNAPRAPAALSNSTPPAYLNAPRQSFIQSPPQNLSAPVYQPPRRDTGELVPPPSVTENTTRLLETPIAATKTNDKTGET